MNAAPRLDVRFLTVHPVTAKWWAQREKCRTCSHYIAPLADTLTKVPKNKNMAERCDASRNYRPQGGGKPLPDYCIDARAGADERDDGRVSICGPDAVLWEPKV